MSVWLTPDRKVRSRTEGPGAGTLSPDKIVAAAIRLLDAHGVNDFSMRRLATELGVTPMSVYWHVANKDDLLELALDAVSAEIDVEPAPGQDWSEELRSLVTAWRRTMITHPWAIRCLGDYLNIGPHSLRVTARAQDAIQRSPLSEADRSAALAAIFQYAYGFVAMEVRWIDYARQSNATTDEYLALLSEQMRTDGGPQPGGVLARSDETGIEQVRDRDFDQALSWLLAGINGSAPSSSR